jgi:GrpB-like predicted nucleotidyltransferase (UPF0157 family)
MTNFLELYNSTWKAEFEELKHLLVTELEGFQIDIQHVGSTSIPGLLAKPILDIDLIINDKTLLDDVSARLEEIGYVNKGEQGIPGRFACRQTSELTPRTATLKKWQVHHLYVCFSDSLALKNHLLFRDALLGDQRLTEQYAQLKRALLTEQGITREEYTKRKTEFILSLLTTLGLDTKELNQIKHANT